MSQVDIAGAILAAQLSEGRVSTVAVNNFTFKKPIYIGDLVSFYVKIVKIGNTSITVDVEVWAQRKRYQDNIKVTEATLTYVAIDDDINPRQIKKNE